MAAYVDLLEEDKPIAQQKFVCVSFVSPENILKRKELYFFDQFVKHWDMTKSFQKYSQFTSFLAYKYNLSSEQLMDDLNDFCKEEKEKMASESVEDDYKTFLDNHGDKLENEFSKENQFQTNTRGIKIRGVFPTQDEAEKRAKFLRENDPHFDVYVGPVGIWMPWEPDAYKTGNVQFLESQLNDLMANKKQNEEKAKEYFDARVKEAKRKAIEENIRKAKESGNVLTQTIDKDSNLINLKTSSSEVLKNALFDNDNLDRTPVPPVKK